MAENDPMSQGMCAAARAGCKELRTLENQNLVLNLRAEITGMLDATRQQIDAKFDQLLRDLGYSGDATSEPGVTLREPAGRREKDAKVSARVAVWLQKNGIWVLVTTLALVAGNQLHPFATRILEALTVAIEGLLK